MFEKVNPSHPDKVADRIAGAIVDLAYKKQEDPRIAVEVLLGHGECHIISETSAEFSSEEIEEIVERIVGRRLFISYNEVAQDKHLYDNQVGKIRCGDNGIFCGMPMTGEQRELSHIAKLLYRKYPTDGKFILAEDKLIICQSNADYNDLLRISVADLGFTNYVINPLGDWTGGIEVDSGATNRKLGSDMGDAVTGGGLHGKDLSKADVSVNIYAHIRAQQTGEPVKLYCAIGDEYVDGLPYSAIVETAKDYVFNFCGGFENFAEWGLI